MNGVGIYYPTGTSKFRLRKSHSFGMFLIKINSTKLFGPIYGPHSTCEWCRALYGGHRGLRTFTAGIYLCRSPWSWVPRLCERAPMMAPITCQSDISLGILTRTDVRHGCAQISPRNPPRFLSSTKPSNSCLTATRRMSSPRTSS